MHDKDNTISQISGTEIQVRWAWETLDLRSRRVVELQVRHWCYWSSLPWASCLMVAAAVGAVGRRRSSPGIWIRQHRCCGGLNRRRWLAAVGLMRSKGIELLEKWKRIALDLVALSSRADWFFSGGVWACSAASRLLEEIVGDPTCICSYGQIWHRVSLMLFKSHKSPVVLNLIFWIFWCLHTINW
jgi:hypothetical protein